MRRSWLGLCSALVFWAFLAGSAWADPLPTREILSPWVDRQTSDGAFPDWPGSTPGGGGGYAESMLGLALAAQGARDGDAAMTAAGERALGWALDHPSATVAPRPSVFEDLALVTALLDLGPSLSAGMRERLSARVGATALLRPIERGYSNFALAEALRVLSAQRAGIAVTESDVLTAVSSLARALPHYGLRYASRAGGRRTAVFSDPPGNPVAYHALTLGLYARAVRLLGASATPEQRALVVALAEGSAALMAPDGDVAYWGRSQEQAWALAFTAYGAQEAAAIEPRRAPRMRALAARALDRLRALHVDGGGLLLTPGLAQPAQNGDARAGLDEYASLPAYTGLTALALTWIDPAFAAGEPRGPLPADRPGAWTNSGRGSAWATVRTDTRWWAIKARPGFARSDDGRWDFGLLAFKRLAPDGGWRDVLPLRPFDRRTACGRGTCVNPPPTNGPSAVTSAGLARPVGETLRVGPRERVTVRGHWVKPDGTIHAPMIVQYAPDPAGVRMTWRGFAPGQAFELGAQFDGRDGPVCAVNGRVGNGGSSVASSQPTTILRTTGGLASGSQRDITSATLSLTAPSAAPLSVVYADSGVGCPA